MAAAVEYIHHGAGQVDGLHAAQPAVQGHLCGVRRRFRRGKGDGDQRVAAECIGRTADVSAYEANRKMLVDALSEYGYEIVPGKGAFYLFIKAKGGDSRTFCERAKAYDLLIVASDSFGYPGYARISYCVSPKMIERSLPAFKKLIEEYE